MTRRVKQTKNKASKISARTITGPGACVSVDQLESRTLGLIGPMKGTPTVQRYRCATVYVDHSSRLSYIRLQKSLTSEETVQGKVAFEKFCEARGAPVLHYHADNGRFADKGFVNHVTQCGQSITYCGVNAHFQNGMAEKRIRDLQDQTTTMLMHAEARWPDVILDNLWPYALREANETLNATPNKVTGAIANQAFSGSDAPTIVRPYQPFGCPPGLQPAAGKSIPKWYKRARVGVYLGRSSAHAQSVALVLSLSTVLVSPQFHVKFDDLFETVKGKNTFPNNWKSATHFRKKMRDRGKDHYQAGAPEERIHEPEVVHERDEVPAGVDEQEAPTEINQDERLPVETPAEKSERRAIRAIGRAAPGRVVFEVPDEQAEIRRWSRRHKPTQRLIESQAQASARATAMQATSECNCEASTNNDYDTDVYHGTEEYEIQRQMSDPITFAASADPDIMYLHQAMKEPDKKQFVQAMINEVTTHTKRGHWKIIPIGEVPEGTKILPAVWAMRRKRRILSREVFKWKARLNVHGGKQTYGVDYWETYAAALKWSSIRFFLTQSLINK